MYIIRRLRVQFEINTNEDDHLSPPKVLLPLRESSLFMAGLGIEEKWVG